MARKTSLFSGLRNNPDNVTKAMIIDFVSGRTKQTKKSTKETIDTFLDVIKEVADAGGYITLKSFGTFKITKRKATTRKLTVKQRKMLSTRKTSVRVPASKKLVFSASKSK